MSPSFTISYPVTIRLSASSIEDRILDAVSNGFMTDVQALMAADDLQNAATAIREEVAARNASPR